MSHYFSLEPVGVGTREVECLASYILRMAHAHGVTRFQLMTHLRYWWARGCGRTLPRCEELRWSGYSQNVKLALAALEAATDRDLSPCTLVALSGICAGNCIGSVRHARYWCPACYREDLEHRSFVYDRLIWQIQGYDRCSVHKHALLCICHKCGEDQRNDKSTPSLHLCSACGADLSKSSARKYYRQRPNFGESQVEVLVEALSKKPKFCRSSPLKRYLAAMKRNGADINQMELLLGDVFHTRPFPVRPQLNSLLAVAVYFDTDLVSILSEPTEAARQTNLAVGTLMPERRKRPFAAWGRRRADWIKHAFQAAIEGPPPYPSLAAFCRQHDYSMSSATHFHRGLSRQLSQMRTIWLEECKTAAIERAAACAAQIRRSSPSLARKKLIARVATEADVPVHLVRKLCRT